MRIWIKYTEENIVFTHVVKAGADFFVNQDGSGFIVAR